MSLLRRVGVTARRILVRRPWIHWLVVVIAALGAGASILDRTDRVDAARAEWGRSVAVVVAERDHNPGDPLVGRLIGVPAAIAPDGALRAVDGAIARQRIAAGDLVHEADVSHDPGPLALTPGGWLAVPVVESPWSGAEIGDRVRVASDGLVVSGQALVVGRHDDVTLVAVPADEAPLLPAAAQSGSLTLLLEP